MLKRLQVKAVRFMTRRVVQYYWRGKIPTHIARHCETLRVENGQIRAFIYKPETTKPLPITVFYHGGGFVFGDVDVYDPICRELCDKTQHIIVSIDYRLAPEHPFPTAPKDCLSGLEWVIEHAANLGGDPQQIFVAGDSAGGNLAAVTAIQAKQHFPASVKGQVLIYPVTDHYTKVTPSYMEHQRGPGLTRNQLIWAWDHYLKDGVTQHDLATPLSVKDLHGLPPALVITAERDPLRDEGNAYAKKLSKFNVEVQHSVYKGQKHGFVGIFGPHYQHRQAVAEIANWLNAQLSRLKQAEQATDCA